MVTSLLVENYYNSGRVGQNDSDYGALFSQVKLMTVTISPYYHMWCGSICLSAVQRSVQVYTSHCTGVGSHFNRWDESVGRGRWPRDVRGVRRSQRSPQYWEISVQSRSQSWSECFHICLIADCDWRTISSCLKSKIFNSKERSNCFWNLFNRNEITNVTINTKYCPGLYQDVRYSESLAWW